MEPAMLRLILFQQASKQYVCNILNLGMIIVYFLSYRYDNTAICIDELCVKPCGVVEREGEAPVLKHPTHIEAQERNVAVSNISNPK